MMCLSKPFVRSIAWRDLADYEGHFISHGGLNHADLSPKSAWEAYRRFRTSYQARGKARLIGLEPLDLDLPESLKLFEPPSP